MSLDFFELGKSPIALITTIISNCTGDDVMLKYFCTTVTKIQIVASVWKRENTAWKQTLFWLFHQKCISTFNYINGNRIINILKVQIDAEQCRCQPKQIIWSSQTFNYHHALQTENTNVRFDCHLRDNSLSEADFKRGDGARLGSVEPLPAFLAHPFLNLSTTHAKQFSTAKCIFRPKQSNSLSYFYRHAPSASWAPGSRCCRREWRASPRRPCRRSPGPWNHHSRAHRWASQLSRGFIHSFQHTQLTVQ